MKSFIKTLILTTICVLCIYGFTACGNNGNVQENIKNSAKAELVSANGWTINRQNGKMSVSNDTETYSFINQIQVSAGASWSISTDIYGMQTIATKTIPLNIGDNIVYLLITSGNGENINLYTMTVRRRPIYTVSFNTNGGSTVDSQQVEEDGFATKPTTTKIGYTLNGWDYDFTKPLINNTEITAIWAANTDTPYKVEHYLENFEDDNYTLYETENKVGTTDTIATAEIKTFEHFTIISNRVYIYNTVIENIVSAKIDANGDTILKVYYQRNRYNVEIDSYHSSIRGGYYKEGTIIPDIAFTVPIGYEWQGWYNSINDELITTDLTLPSFVVDKDVHYVAKDTVKEELSNFYFDADTGYCVIFGVIDKTITEAILPDYVTEIYQGAFQGCDGLTNVIFENTSGWGVRYWYDDYTIGTFKPLSSIDLANSSIAATYLKNTYSAYIWLVRV